jgi:hypothetical protein
MERRADERSFEVRDAEGRAMLAEERHASPEAADQPWGEDDDRRLRELLAERARRVAPVAPARESELLERINAGLPEPRARRLEVLNALREAESLTGEEYEELLGLVDEAERLAVRRAEALAELAHTRGTTLPALMRDLGLEVVGRG